MGDPVVSNIILLQIKKVAESSDGDFQRCGLTCHVTSNVVILHAMFSDLKMQQ